MPPSVTDRSSNPARGAWVVASIYAAVSGLWILLSDRALGLLTSDPQALITGSLLKGWFFVAVTTLLLHVLVRGLLTRQHEAYRREIEALHDRQRTADLLTAIAENSADAIFAKDLEGRYLLFNRAATRFAGQRAEDILGRDDHALFPPDQAAMLQAIDRHVRSTGAIETNREVLDTLMGRRTFEATKEPLRDAEQRIFGTFGVSRDITDLEQAQQALRESEQRLRLLVEHSPVALALFDRDMKYLAASDRWLADFQLSERSFIGRSHYELFPDVDETARALHRRGLAGESLVHEEERDAGDGGPVRSIRWAIRPWPADDGSVGGIVISSEDVSARRAAERTLRQTAADLQATLQAIPDLLFEIDAEGRYLSVKALRESLLAAPANELGGHTVHEVLPPEAAATVMAAVDAAARNGSDYGRVIALPLPQGLCHFEISVARKQTGPGQPARFIVLSRDVTARRNFELELQARNAELERFNRASVDREIDMIELKKTINALSIELGRAPPHDLGFLDSGRAAP